MKTFASTLTSFGPVLFLGLVASCVGALPLRAELRIATDFESGSARVLRLDAATQTMRITPAGDLKRGIPNWWFLRLDNVTPGKLVTLEVAASDVAMGGRSEKSKPLSPVWTLPTCAAVSTDGAHWEQSSPGNRDGQIATYRVTTDSPTLWLAWGPPFTGTDAVALVDRIEKAHAFAKKFTLARSLEGRPVPGLQLYEGPAPTSQRPAVWMTGRQHAWECGGSWVTVGFIEWLVSEDEAARWLRQHAEVFVVPVMDVDHVATGDGGKGASPQDHNRDWSPKPHWPEVAAAQQRILALAKEGRMSVFLDSHNPGPGAPAQTFYVQYPPYLGEPAAALQEKFLADARAAFGEIRLIDGKPSLPEHLPIWECISTSWVIQHSNPQTIAFTVETPWNTSQGTPEGYRAVGRKLGLATEKFLRENPR